jgi:putative ABC transport system substrate-binding protein
VLCGRGAAAGKSFPHRFFGRKHCFWYGRAFGDVPARDGQLGWIEGKNITIEYRFAEQKPERLPELAVDLVSLKVDLIVIAGTAAALAAKNATTTIPIVMANAGDPVGVGLVASLARPGGNVTGLEGLGPELNTKRLEVLKDAVPKLTRVGLLLASGSGIGRDLQLKELRPAAVALKLKLEEIETQPAKV